MRYAFPVASLLCAWALPGCSLLFDTGAGTPGPSAGRCPEPTFASREYPIAGTQLLRGVTLDADCNTLVCGEYVGAFSLEGGILPEGGDQDAYLAELDGSGNVAWQFGFRTAGAESCSAVTAGTGGGEFFAVGTFDGVVPFPGQEAGSAGGSDIWVARLRATSELAGVAEPGVRWSRRLGTPGEDAVTSIVLGPQGTIVIAGSLAVGAVSSDGELPAGLTEQTAADAVGFVAALDARSGEFLWGFPVDRLGADTGVVSQSVGGLAVDGAHIYAAATVAGPLDACDPDPDPDAGPHTDAVLYRVSEAGAVELGQVTSCGNITGKIGLEGKTDRGNGVAVVAPGRPCLAGTLAGPEKKFPHAPFSNSAQPNAIFAACWQDRVGESSLPQWIHVFGSPDADRFTGLALDDAGGMWLAGDTRSAELTFPTVPEATTVNNPGGASRSAFALSVAADGTVGQLVQLGVAGDDTVVDIAGAGSGFVAVGTTTAVDDDFRLLSFPAPE